MSRLRGPVVLVDQATEQFPVPHRRVKRHDDRLVMIGWSLLPGLVRPMTVIVHRVDPQHYAEMALATVQHPVRALGPVCPARSMIRLRPAERSRRRPGGQ